MATTKNLAEAIRRKLTSDNALAAAVDAERFNLNVGSVIYEARNKAGLTQQQLAERIGTHQSAIARLEDADYDGGHSLKTLERIAFALGKRIEISFVEQSAAPRSSLTGQFVFESLTWEGNTATFPLLCFFGTKIADQPDEAIFQVPRPPQSANTSVIASTASQRGSING